MTYNLGNTRGSVRIGNWQEELVLEKNTGVRFAPNPKDRANGLLTKSRVIDHSDFVPVNKFQSTAQSTLINPFQHKDFVGVHGQGPRRKFVDQTLRAQVDQEFKNEADSELNDKMKPQYLTLNAEKFSREGFSESIIMNDPTVRVDTKSANYTSEPAITYYSEAIKQNDSLNFPVSYINNTSTPFNKSQAFSADIHNSSTRRCESHERPGAYPKVSEFQILRKMCERIMSQVAAGEFTVGSLVSLAWNMEEEDGSGLIHIASFASAVEQVFCLKMTDKELQALHVMMDMHASGHMPIREFIALVRGPFSAHRVELVSIAFAQCDLQQTGQVTDQELSATFANHSSNNAFASLMAGLNSVRMFSGRRDRTPNGLGEGGTVELCDFLEHYMNVSAVLATDIEFEKQVRLEWNL